MIWHEPDELPEEEPEELKSQMKDQIASASIMNRQLIISLFLSRFCL